MLTIRWHDQTLHLLPERALLWTRSGNAASGGVLVLADLHLGKPAAFRAAGIPVPEVIDTELDELSQLIERHKPEVLLIAGDLLHARAGRSDHVLGALHRWRSRHRTLEIILVRGNHDRSAGDPPSTLRLTVVDEPFVLHPDDPIAIAHDPAATDHPDRPLICGHLHPSVTLGDGLTSLRAPCFWVRPRQIILPARGRFTGTRGISPSRGDRVFVTRNDQVIEARAPITDPAVVVRSRRPRAGKAH
ncbi:MAG: ligase-associated DNA damage response endonuclease PdeM [Phycisphaerales bacterium]|nr:ligase-associated DNA damage response endonuclease PdeM [Phycisphaerales bacterium]